MKEKIYEYIVHFITENGYPPTVREIGEGVGLASSSSVAYYLGELEHEKKIKTKERKPRTISVCGYKFEKAES